MIPTALRMITISALLLMFAISGYAAEPEKLEKVVVSGMGITVDAARQNALRAAVEQVVGTYLLSDTMVQNSALINDEILSYSGGYVKQSRVIGTRRDGDLYVVQVEAVVVSTKVRRKLEELNIAVRKVDGGSLFGEAATRIGEKRDGAALLAHVTRKFPQAAYRFAIGSPAIERVDHQQNKAIVKVPIAVTWDREFLAEYLDAVKSLARGELADPLLAPDLARKGEGVLCVSSKENIKSVHADICYRLDLALYEGLGVKTPIYRSNNGPTADLWRNLVLSLKFKNAAGGLVHRSELSLDYTNSDRFEWHFSKGEYKETFDVTRNFSGNTSGFNYPNMLWRNNNRALIVLDGEYRITPTITFEADKLQQVTRIEVSLSQQTR